MEAKKTRGLKVALVAVPLVAALCWIVLSVVDASGAGPRGPAATDTDRLGSEVVGADPATAGDPARRSVATRPDAPETDLLGIRGRVLDPTGEPASGALVGEVASDRPAVTAADGRFELYAETGIPSITLLVLVDGQAPFLSTHELQLGEPSIDVGDIRLVPAGSIRGRITDAAGNGLPGATAVLRLRDWNSWLPLDVAELSSPAETDAEGIYSFAELMPGRYRIEASAPGREHKRSGTVRVREGEESDVDPIVLDTGLRITGTVSDSVRGRPVERFAARIRRVGELDPPSNGTMAQQLQRHIDDLRETAARATDPDARAEQLRIATDFESRLQRLRQQEQSRPVAVPSGIGPVEERPGGRFVFDGLQEGLYAVGIASPEHQFAEVEPIEVRRAMPPPDLRVELVAGHGISGIVVRKQDGRPVAGATVELARVLEALPDARTEGRSLYPWAFARSGPAGVVVMATRTGEDGRFELRQASEGRCFLSIRHPETADHDTDVFFLRGNRESMRIAVGARANLTGRIGNIPLGQEGNVEVFVLGGHGTMRTFDANADGTYRCDGLQPGGYLVRAFPADDDRYVSRLFGSIFPLHAGAVDPERIPPLDVALAEGETRVLDLQFDLPASGSVQGSVTINGQPATGGRAILRPVPGEAPGSGGLSLRRDYDETGRFTIPEVPAGNYTLELSGATRQVLRSEPVTVDPGAIASVQVDLLAGGLRGRVTAADTASIEELRGTLWVLPGAAETPDDPYAYRRTERTHRIRVRNGEFEDEALTPGAAVLVLEMRGRARAVSRVVVPKGDVLELDLVAGGRLQ